MSEEHVFERGDIVMLKAGSPQMIVVGYLENSSTVACEWFHYGSSAPALNHMLVHEDCLKLC